ncbi:HD domain-containing phosphohydrolase [uncultured Desulfovibrio sp.]|uniref:HD-GYP domain-containing protein n=1 Tax=uncultured Desulfovibrio sp. TaxID=167968 RepID=UPI00260CE374|nr:HD domain-containing phosphohydrolase [uncultured Desulfovibrio sp.]
MRNPERLSLLPLFAGLCLLLVLTVTVTMRFDREAQREILDRTGSQLSAYSSTVAAMMTVWSGVQRDAAEDMARYDMLRLLASEIMDTTLPVALLRELGETPWTEQDHGRYSDLDQRQRQALHDMAPHVALIYRKLAEFMVRHDLAGVALLTRTFEPALLLGQGGQREVLGALRQRFAKEPPSATVMLPVRLQNERLLVDLVCPVTAPDYVSTDGGLQGLLLVTCDIGRLLQGIGQSAKAGYLSLLLEKGGGLAQAIAIGKRPSIDQIPLPEGFGQDMTPRSMVLPAASGTADCLVVGQAVPGTSWYATVACRADSVLQEQRERSWRVWAIAGLLFLCLGGFLVWFYWWLGVRRERSEAREQKELYAAVVRQRVLLDTVIRALRSALALVDKEGRITYANTEFARLARCQGDVRHLMQVRHLPDYLARSLERHVEFVLRTGTEFSDSEDMLVEGRLIHFSVQCLPFSGEGELAGNVVVIYRDITARVEAERRLATMLRQTVKAFTHAVEAVDPYLKGQSGFAGELAYHLAAWLGKDDPAMEATLRTAANLSQVGMIRLPHALLTKSSPLTAAERSQMERHVEYAVDALRGIDFGLPVLQTIEQMYERMDGSGYPRKLQGEAICLQARILAVANTFCALMRPRSYRRRHDEPGALAILRERPFKYDQQVVDALEAFLHSAQGKDFVRDLQQ